MKIETRNPQTAIPDPQSQIFLVGFMASGKSTVGPLLAAKLNRTFVDLDNLIVARVDCAIADFIAREGEERFRQIETEILREAAQGEIAVIAPGGGAITRLDNRALMSRYGTTIWLDAPFELCWQRIQQDGAVRPLAPNEAAARERYERRLSFYRQSSIHITIDESHSPDEIADVMVSAARRFV
jgi:shikimate kinase